MHLIIATDEAGYGPKLGPLVITATVWRVPSLQHLVEPFANFSVPLADPRCGKVLIDDSKKVFKRGQRLTSGQEPLLDVVCRAASTWASIPNPIRSFRHWLQVVAPLDFHTAAQTPWFVECLKDVGIDSSSPDQAPTELDSPDQALIDHWSANGLELRDLSTRMITARAFNSLVDRGMNKADILTESTCELVGTLLAKHGESATEVSVFSDRHGGRAYYGAALQQRFPDARMSVLHEDKNNSRYELAATPSCGRIEWSFTVSGDSYAPVAMSSMIAKWLRERAMTEFNRFFQLRVPTGMTLPVTAGYPTDADRFIDDLARLGMRAGIPDAMLIRQR